MNDNNKYLIVGLGLTGLAVARFLLQRGASFSVCDSRTEPPGLADFRQLVAGCRISPNLTLGSLAIPEGTTHIIISPGLARSALQTALPIIGDVELFLQHCSAPVLAITGSNGKSTVTTLTGLMATQSAIKTGVGGNLGTPVLDLLEAEHKLYVLELSSFQLESINSLRAKVATILNISPDHMDRYPDFATYVQAKQRIYQGAESIVYNRNDSNTYPPAETSCKNIISFGLDKPANSHDYGLSGDYLVRGSEPLLDINQLQMLGSHNISNALAALAIGEIAGFQRDAMLQVLKSFRGLEHRCQLVRKFDEVVWLNDSKGTNVAATLCTLQGVATSISGKWVLILGGMAKGADFTPLIDIAKYCRAAVIIGEASHAIQKVLQEQVSCYLERDLQAACRRAKSLAKPGDGVLLSPACASWDMFRDYQERGQQFQAIVETM